MPEKKPSPPVEREKRTRQRKSGGISSSSKTVRQATDGKSFAKRRRPSMRAGLAVMGGRAAGAISRRLHLGGGTSIAGVVAQRLYPDIVNHLSSQLAYGSVLVTGTNGKTTTSGFIAAILSDAGLRVWRNREGSNLMRGIAGALVIRARAGGNLRRSGQAISIFEVDEAVVPHIIKAVPLRVAVFTNLFRDQLDRYGEVDSVSARWQQAVNALPKNTTLVLNADDPAVASLGETYQGNVVYFGIDDASLDLVTQGISPERHQTIDTRTCAKCGNELTYTLRFYSHLGHYHCPHCGSTRPQAEVRATSITLNAFDQLRITIATPTQQGEIVIPLPGFYNIYNALAAIAATQALQINWEPIVSGIQQFKPAFGRGERVQVAGRTIRILMAKNPTGFNEVLRTLFSDGEKRRVLLILNDNIADGRDVSWIWDVDFERMAQQTASLTATGTRALDLGLRLKYAGIEPQAMSIIPLAPLRADNSKDAPAARMLEYKAGDAMSNGRLNGTQAAKPGVKVAQKHGLANALDHALQETPVGETLFVIPTYTGLLDIHRELERRGLTPHYWEEKGP
ncbi:MAG TPA: MurT ligase domain-containing protein [Ktedonobacteraceae bacterium]|nr:MurT ligase domain-containing protein [Ktedonobacteraceae bacterium]